MKLDEERARDLYLSLNPFDMGVKCSVCEGRKWQVSDKVLELREYESGPIAMGPAVAVLPVIAAVCATCGQVLLFSAITRGAVGETPDRGPEHP